MLCHRASIKQSLIVIRAPGKQSAFVLATLDGSSYKGLRTAFLDGQRFLYAADIGKGRIDISDIALHLVAASTFQKP